ncbi:hypothetical protein EMIHUDRAFT_450475, partial [Emiliania huxleyi CCMP1516]|uniref:Uncharacterized protein n=2 Tax=Emiliania huxleyi TaxID=2903 RepID=A0A0D3JNX0_EMIH1
REREERVRLLRAALARAGGGRGRRRPGAGWAAAAALGRPGAAGRGGDVAARRRGHASLDGRVARRLGARRRGLRGARALPRPCIRRPARADLPAAKGQDEPVSGRL